ncbi:hypothetical protein [uncultured Tateyamaria sp.]|uniref:hypothetical protein n=1 Tax=uncultured Tateyamaria sp. TaxID=455651 RepID=UPI00261B5683|nr:hypothetical protein [uncultured Tateyamaria sp.]
MDFVKALCAAAFCTALAAPAYAATYNISFDGSFVDLSGTIDISTTGSFDPAGFDAVVTGYSITATTDGTNPFTFTETNSTFGPGTGTTITVSATDIILSTSETNRLALATLFLAADVATNNTRENLRLTTTQLGFRAPTNPTVPNTAFENITTPFTLAQVAPVAPVAPVPLPAGLPLLAVGIGLFAGLRWRKARSRA